MLIVFSNLDVDNNILSIKVLIASAALHFV